MPARCRGTTERSRTRPLPSWPVPPLGWPGEAAPTRAGCRHASDPAPRPDYWWLPTLDANGHEASYKISLCGENLTGYADLRSSDYSTYGDQFKVAARMCPHLPYRSAIAHLLSRFCISAMFSWAVSERRRPHPARTALIARSRLPRIVSGFGERRSVLTCSALSQLPSRTPTLCAPFTRRMPGRQLWTSRGQ